MKKVIAEVSFMAIFMMNVVMVSGISFCTCFPTPGKRSHGLTEQRKEKAKPLNYIPPKLNKVRKSVNRKARFSTRNNPHKS